MFQRGVWDISQLPSPQIHSSAFLVLTRLHPSPAPVCPSTPVRCGQWETRLQIQEPGGDRLEVSLPCSPCSVTTFLPGASSPPVAVRKLASQMMLPLGSRRGVLPSGGPASHSRLCLRASLALPFPPVLHWECSFCPVSYGHGGDVGHCVSLVPLQLVSTNMVA